MSLKETGNLGLSRLLRRHEGVSSRPQMVGSSGGQEVPGGEKGKGKLWQGKMLIHEKDRSGEGKECTPSSLVYPPTALRQAGR